MITGRWPLLFTVGGVVAPVAVLTLGGSMVGAAAAGVSSGILALGYVAELQRNPSLGD
jgi:hypothetical protein